MDKAGDKQAGANQPDKNEGKGRSKSSKKKLPDISKLGSARPTKIPRNVKEAEAVQLPSTIKVNWKLFFSLAAGIVFLCLAVYSITLWNGLAASDTKNFIEIRQGLQSEDFWLDLFSSAVARPLGEGWSRATFAWDLTSFNWNPGWSHLVNICLHAFTCFYLYCFVFRLSWRIKNEDRWQVNPYFVATVAAALFAVHPLATGAVAYISGRSGVLVSLNYFLTLNCFLAGFLSEGIALAVFMYLLCFILITIALFCSPQAITLPLAMVATACLIKPPSDSWKVWMRTRGVEIVLFIVMAIGMPFALLLNGLPGPYDNNGIGMPALPKISYWATQLKSLLSYYMRCTVLPLGLTALPPYTVAKDFSDPLALLGALALIGSAALLFVRQNAVSMLGLMIFLLGLFPNLLVVQPEYISDQRFYLSLAGLCIVAGGFSGKYYLKNAKQAMAVAGAVVVVFSALTVWRCLDWKNDSSLWKQAVALNPESAEAHTYYAQALSSEHKYFEARKEAEKALQISPSDSYATLVIARSLVGEKNYSDAIKPLEKALAIASSSKSQSARTAAAELQKDLGYCYMHLGRSNDALRMGEQAAQVIPDDPMIHLVMGTALVEMKSYMPAYLHLQQGFSADPSNKEFLVPLAEAALDSGQTNWLNLGIGAAIRAYESDKSEKNTCLYARALLGAKVPKRAIAALEPLLKSGKASAETKWIAAAAQELNGNEFEAQKLRAEALKMDPKIASKVRIPTGKEPVGKPIPMHPSPPGQQPNRAGAGKPAQAGKNDMKPSAPAPQEQTKPNAPAPQEQTKPPTP